MPYNENTSAPVCGVVTKQQSMKESIQDANKCLLECVLTLMDLREQFCGRVRDPEKLPDPTCLLDEAMYCDAQSHKLLDLVREIQAVVI